MDIVDKAITVIIVAAVIPAALTSVNNANKTGWTTTQTALWGLIGIMVIIAVVKYFAT
jgi:predicted membrane channel-forming protein YqfA (hemolysin III family)